MKKHIAALGAFAFVIGAMPIAKAQPNDTDKVRDIVIDVKGEVLPTDLGQLEYPYNAASKGRTGKCSIKLTVSEAGNAGNYAVESCSHASFRRAAALFAETLEYPRSSEGETHDLVVTWSVED